MTGDWFTGTVTCTEESGAVEVFFYGGTAEAVAQLPPGTVVSVVVAASNDEITVPAEDRVAAAQQCITASRETW